MKILVTGDLAITKKYEAKDISTPLIKLFKESDLNIVNLEAPITDWPMTLSKTGPNIKSDKISTLDVLKYLNVNLVTLANNHVLDYDEQGVKDTLHFCEENDFESVGAGINLEHASKTRYLNSEEGRIAIVNFAENEWASATKSSAGANPMSLIDNSKQIKDAKKNSDYVFVIIHGGHEYYNLPSPRMQEHYRFYAEQGADIIIGHHTHCISGNEVWQGVPIFYSLGNFLFTETNNHHDWYLGLVLEININNGIITTNLHPVEQQKNDFKLKLLEEKNRDIILKRVNNLSVTISDGLKLRKAWEDYISSKVHDYLYYWSPINFIKNRYLRAAFNRIGLRFLNKRAVSLLLNLMRCESHHEISQESLKKYLSK